MTRIFSLFPLSRLFNLDGFSSGLMKSGARLFLLASLMVLAACTEDKDFNTDKKTADFTEQNFEMSALAITQAALLAPAHIPLFDVLVPGDIPFDLETVETELAESCFFNESADQYECRCIGYEAPEPEAPELDVCERTNTACFSFEHADAPAHPVGNKVFAQYNECDVGLGLKYVGTAEFKDTKFEGLARNLESSTTQQCIGFIEQDLAELRSSQGKRLEMVNIYFVDGMELFFVPSGSDTLVRVRSIEPDQFGDDQEVLRDERIIDKDETAILVLQGADTTDADKLTSDGNVVYSVIDRKEKLQLCDSMYRTLSAELTDFGVIRDDFSAYMNGVVTLRSSTEDFLDFSGRISDDSNYSIRIEEGSLSSVYKFEEVQVIKGFSTRHMSFDYRVAGYINLDGVGKALMVTPFVLTGERNEPYLRRGQVTTTGADFDSIRITVQDRHMLKVEAAPEGSEQGNGLPTYSLSRDVPWERLLTRDFEHAED